MTRPLTPSEKIQGRLLSLAALFLFFYSVALSLAQAGRMRTFATEYRLTHWFGFIVWLAVFAVAHRQVLRFLPESDPYLLPVVAFLSGWGLLTIWRLTPTFGLRQTVWLGIAGGLFIAGLRASSDLGFLRRYKYLWLTGGLGLTALTLLLGSNPMGFGPRLWLGCCGVYLQPSEPLKLLLIVYLAAYLADRQTIIHQLRPLLAPTVVMTGLVLLLLVAQRDLGTASIFLFLYTAIVYAATGNRRFLSFSGVGLAVAGLAGTLLFDVVRLRMEAWLNPWLDPSGRSYQIVQSLIAVAAGGVLGRGPGMGSPGLVPISHSDFIFTSIVEESGLVGALGLLALLSLLTVRGLQTALNAQGVYRRYLAAGITAYFAAQSILIIGGNLRVLPLTGVTLPFVSYGGSSLVTSFLAALILLHFSQRPGTAPAPLPRPRPYTALGGFLLAGLSAAAIAAGWWGFVRGPDLLTRTDNARRAIADRYVHRGALSDREDRPLAVSEGKPGEFERFYAYSALGAVIGYTHSVYGQSGLEASLDPILRGERGPDPLAIWWSHLLYGQPPPGVDVRLSLDLDMQAAADSFLEGHKGAAVLLNAETGEIYVLASHPTFDPNDLDAAWNDLIEDPNAPLLNRATLGGYNPGEAIHSLFYQSDILDSLGMQNLFDALGYYDSLELRLPIGPANPTPDPNIHLKPGQMSLRLSPLQMCLSAAVLSSGGILPAPRLAMAMNVPETGWQALPALGSPTQVISPQDAETLAHLLALPETQFWQSLTLIGGTQPLTWFIGGTLPGQDTPLAVAVLLEEDNEELASAIGRGLLELAVWVIR